jgi:hypothetical protein
VESGCNRRYNGDRGGKGDITKFGRRLGNVGGFTLRPSPHGVQAGGGCGGWHRWRVGRTTRCPGGRAAGGPGMTRPSGSGTADPRRLSSLRDPALRRPHPIGTIDRGVCGDKAEASASRAPMLPNAALEHLLSVLRRLHRGCLAGVPARVQAAGGGVAIVIAGQIGCRPCLSLLQRPFGLRRFRATADPSTGMAGLPLWAGRTGGQEAGRRRAARGVPGGLGAPTSVYAAWDEFPLY